MRESTYQDLVRVFRSVLAYIQQNLDEPLDVEQLADVAGFSPFHFQRSFQRVVGEPAIVHVRRLRMERAAYQLANTQTSISAIADSAGFGSLAAFSRAFAEAFSVSPRHYRSQAWSYFWQPSPTGVHYQPDTEPEFQPLPPRGTPASARIETVNPFQVLAIPHNAPVGYMKAWERLYDLLSEHGICGSDHPQVVFTRAPRRASEAWKVRGYVSIAADQTLPPGTIETHQVGGGYYLVKTHRGPATHLGDSWARMRQEDRLELRVKPRYGIAFMRFETPQEIYLFMPIHPPAN